jgi:hypothetical protein
MKEGGFDSYPALEDLKFPGIARLDRFVQQIKDD